MKKNSENSSWVKSDDLDQFGTELFNAVIEYKICELKEKIKELINALVWED